MKGLIIAAGRGQRLGHLTDDRPKCLLKVGGRELLDWQVAALTCAAVEPLAVVRGYRGEMLDGYPVTLIDNVLWSSGNMGLSLLCAKHWLWDEGGIISYADILYAPETVRRLKQAPGALAVAYDRNWQALWERRMECPLSDAEQFRLSPDGAVATIGGRAAHLDEIEGQYMGLVKVTATGWRTLVKALEAMPPFRQAKIDMTALLSLLIDQGTRIDAVATPAAWMEVDTAEDLSLSEAMIASGELALAPGRSGPSHGSGRR